MSSMDLSKKEALLFPRLVFGGLGLRDASRGLDVSRTGLDDEEAIVERLPLLIIPLIVFFHNVLRSHRPGAYDCTYEGASNYWPRKLMVG